VYEYAGGIGTRSGDPADIDHLLVAGLFYAARAARDSGRAEDAARLTDELSRRMPDDPTVKFLVIDSRLKDRHDPAGALAELARMQLPPDNPRLTIRHGLLTAEALSAAGMRDSARALLTALAQRYPESRALKDALDHIH
jgi:predicted Zn-dependent protease